MIFKKLKENEREQKNQIGECQIIKNEEENMDLINYDDDKQKEVEMQILNKEEDEEDMSKNNSKGESLNQTRIGGKNIQDPNRQQFKKKTLINQETYEKQKNQQLKFYQMEKKNEEQHSEKAKSLKDNLLVRKCWRIILLILIIFALLGLSFLFYYIFGFVRGETRFKNNEKVQMNINSCTIMIYDYQLGDSYILDTNILSATLSKPNQLDEDENIYMQWIYPNAPVHEESFSTFDSSVKKGVKNFEFNNKFSDQSCEIVLYVYKETSFEQLNIDCGDSYQCNIIIYSSLLSVKNMNIKGVNVQMNAPFLKVDTKFDYYSMKGHIEIPFFIFKDANIITREGDISIQSAQDINLTFFQKDPFNCLTAKNILQTNGNEIKDLKEYQTESIIEQKKCIEVYPYGIDSTDSKNKDKIIEQRCFKGQVHLRNKDQTPSTLYLENSFGNINVNVISEQGKWPKESDDLRILYRKAVQQNDVQNSDKDYINLSTQSQNNLVNQTKLAQKPQIYDPIFVYHFGPRFSRSSTFQQLHISYNPAYSQMKPYWLGELTLTLMTTKTYQGQYTISPSFCPYVPQLNLERMFSTQQLVKSFMEKNKAPDYAQISTAWQADVPYPSQKFNESDSYDGLRKISLQRFYDDQWIEVEQDESHTKFVTNLDVSQNSSLYAAIIVSAILSAILGAILMILLVFAINQSYIKILNHISCVHKYQTFEKGDGYEIDETTLDSSQRNFYLEYKEKKKNEEEQNNHNNKNENGGGLEQEEREFQPKYTISGIFDLFYKLIYLSPPLCAFIDYIVLFFHKAKQNSIQEFYKQLFRKKNFRQLQEQDEDEEIHNLQKDSIQGNEMKQLYEKFCYLNQYLERKFDDEENIKFLNEKGFKIVLRSDSLTQYYTFIKYNGSISNIVDQSDKSSLDLFISNCCSLTKFDQDRIESSIFDQIYKEFCNDNHLQKQELNESKLKRSYGIQTSYLPQQWIMRDNNFDVEKQKRKYFIDKKIVENSFKIILAKDRYLFNMLYDTEDIKEAQKNIKLPTGWQFFDLVTVVAHIIIMTLLGSPLLLLAIFLRAQQASYSLLPPSRLITLESIQYYPASIPTKLIDENWIVQTIAIITIVFWSLSFWDLIYYYASMDFPQEKYFQEYKIVGRFRKFLTSIMWIIVLIALFSTFIYFSLVSIWLMLSAIINPNAFLPYATSAATFVTLISKKYKEYEEVSQNGFKILSDYLSNLASGQFDELLKKMNIQDKIADVIPTDTIKDLTIQAAQLGIIDSATCNDINNNLEIMIRDPNTFSKMGQELEKISQDPQTFATQMVLKLEEKAKAIIESQVQTIDKELRDELVNLFWCLIKKQKSELKNAISSFVNSLINVSQKKQGKLLLKNTGSLNLNGPVFDFVWEFAFPQENFKGNYKDHILNAFCTSLSSMIQVWNKNVKPIIMLDQQAKKMLKQQDQKEGKNEMKQQLQYEINEDQILKERLQKEFEKTQSITQIDIKQEEEIEIEIKSQEVVSIAYKNIIYSVIQIYRDIDSDNSEVILNQIISLVQNASKIPGFKGLNQVKQYQDVLKLGYSIFKNDGQISYQDISLSIKNFLENTRLEKEIKDIAGVGILDILKVVEVIFESLKNQSKPLSSQNIKKLILNILSPIEFATKRTNLKNQEFKQIDEINDIDEYFIKKHDINKSLEQIQDVIQDKEKLRNKIKQIQEYYNNKQETNIDQMRYFCKVLIEQKSDFENCKVEEIFNLTGEKLFLQFKMLVDDIQNFAGDKNKKLVSQNDEAMQKFTELKQQKVDQEKKLDELQNKILKLRKEIKEIDIIKIHDFNIKINQLKDQLREKEKQKDETTLTLEKSKKGFLNLQKKRISEAEVKNVKDNQSEKSKKSQQSQKKLVKNKKYMEEEEEEKLLNNEQQDTSQQSDVPNENKVNRHINVFLTNNHKRNLQNFEQDEQEIFNKAHEELFQLKENERTEDEEKIAKDIVQQMSKIKNFETEIAQIKSDITHSENEIKRIKKEINERNIYNLENQYLADLQVLNNQFSTQKIDQQLLDLQNVYNKEQQSYDKIINDIKQNMCFQEEIEHKMKEYEENKSSYIKESQLYIDDYKSCQKQLNRIYQEQINIHEFVGQLKEQKQKVVKYSAELEKKYQQLIQENRDIKKEKEVQQQKDTKKENEQRDSLVSSGITLMLSFFSGSISNISDELIYDFGKFFNKIQHEVYTNEEEEVIFIFDFLARYINGEEKDENANKIGGQGKKSMNNFQNVLNLQDMLMNDVTLALKKINRNGINLCNIKKSLVDSLQVLLTARLDGIIDLKTINKSLKGSELLENISKVMKLKENEVLGLMEIILGFKETKDALSFIKCASALNKVKQNKVPILLNLYNLYSSTSPSELHRALQFFQIMSNLPSKFQDVTIQDLVKAMLFMREQLDFSFVQNIIERKLRLLPDSKRELNPKIQLEIKERLKFNIELPSRFRRLLEIEHKGNLNVNTIQQDFKDLNQNNQFLLDVTDFNFFKKFVSLRNIPKIEDASEHPLLKSSIMEISEMLYIDYKNVEFFLNILISSQSKKLQQALDHLNLKQIDPNFNLNSIPNFVDYASSVLEKLESRNQMIVNVQKNILSNVLPISILKKILCTERSQVAYEDYISIFQLYCEESLQKAEDPQLHSEIKNHNIPISILNLIDFRFGICGHKKKNIYQFLFPYKNKQNLSRTDFINFKKNKAGFLKAVQVISIDDESLRIQTFLQYLIDTQQEAFLLMSCLLVYLSGRSHTIKLSFLGLQNKKNKKNKTLTVEQLLSQLLQIKIEFFEAISTFFQEDIGTCVSTMIKFYRQLDYQQQEKVNDKGTIGAMKQNITISEKTIEQYLRLVNRLQISPSFFSKESNIPIEVVELISQIILVKNAQSEQERSSIFDQMRNNAYIIKILQQLSINLQELISLIKIMYQDYEYTNIKQISRQLKLSSNVQIDILQQLIMLNYALPINGDNQQNNELLKKLINENKVVNKFKVNTTWAEITYILSKGYFNLLPKYQDKLIALNYPSSIRFEQVIDYEELKRPRSLTQAVNAKEDQYISLVQGLIGLLSCKNLQFQTTMYLKQLFATISQKYFKEDNINNEDGLKKGNTFQYAIYKFTKCTQISPTWTLLMMGDFNAWQYLAEQYYLVNQCLCQGIHPILVLVYVINFRTNPLIIKQLLVDIEYIQISYQIYIAELKKQNIKRQKWEQQEYEDESDEEFYEQFVKKKKTKKEFKLLFNEDEKQILDEYEQKIKQLKVQINNILKDSIERDAEKLIHLAEKFNFPKKIINMILVYENEIEIKYEEENGEKDQENRLQTFMIGRAFENIERNIQSEENKEIEIINNIFNQVDTVFYNDPRREKFDRYDEEKNFTKNYCLETHISSPIMQMTVLSTIAQLRHSYYKFYGFTKHDKDHQKQVTFAIDLILGTLEKYYYFDDMMDFFPRHRLIPLLVNQYFPYQCNIKYPILLIQKGLSVGFVIETDDILSSMTSQNIFDKQYYDEVIMELCYKVYDKQSEDEYDYDLENIFDQKTFQKYIEYKKFNLKYKYFKDNIINYYGQYQVERNYSYSGIFKGIYQRDVIEELLKKNYEKLIDHFEDFMWSTLQKSYETYEILFHVADSKNNNNVKRSYYVNKAEYDNIDHYSAKKYKNVFEYIDEYQKETETENFRLLVDIFKGNFKLLNNNEIFVSNNEQDSNIFYGMLFLNGIIVQERLEIKTEDFQQSVTFISHNISSNKKVLTGILSLFISSIKTNCASIFEQLNVTNKEVIDSFVDLAMGKSIKQSYDLDNLLKNSCLSEENIKVLKGSICAYQGQLSEHLRLLYSSQLFSESVKAKRLFTKIIWSFEKSQMHKSSDSRYEMNYFDYCNLGINRKKSLENVEKYLWLICKEICFIKYKSNRKLNEIDIRQDEFEKNNIFKGNRLILDSQIIFILENILYNDWNFLLRRNINQIKQEFDCIFQTQPEDKLIEILKFLALLKPEKCGLNITKLIFQENIDKQMVNQMFELGKTSQIEMFANDSDKRSIHLMLSLANNSTIHIINCLNTNDQEWQEDYLEEIQKYEIEKKALEYFKEKEYRIDDMDYEIQTEMYKIHHKLYLDSVQKNQEQREKQSQNSQIDVTINQQYKHAAYILQSLYLWKNISSIDWDSLFKNSAAFRDYPYRFKDLKLQVSFIFNYVDYLTILPAVILDKSELKLEKNKIRNKKKIEMKKETPESEFDFDSITQKVFHKLNMNSRNLDPDIFIDHMNLENNSVDLVQKSYNKILEFMEKNDDIYFDLVKEEPENEYNLLQDQIIEISPNLYYFLQFLNGRIFKEIQKVHPLIEYLSNLYFVGLEAMDAQNSYKIVQYLEKSINDENSFMNQILKENTNFATIFNKILIIMFTISLSSMNDSKIDRFEKETILNSIDDLIFSVGQQDLLYDDTIANFIYAIFYQITGEETKQMENNNRIKDKQDFLIILLKIAFEHPDLSEFFFGSAKFGEGTTENIDTMINTITYLLKPILDKPQQYINNSDFVKENLKLIKYSSKGTIDISIIEDIIAIVTGNHSCIFNLLKKFEIIDENKILLIQRAFNKVVEMPIFKNNFKLIKSGPSEVQSDKMKEIVKKMQEGKATIKDVFVAVDDEGDKSGTISIDEFQQFVKRLGKNSFIFLLQQLQKNNLGMELSKHRVNEIFAYIKNKKLKISSSEKQEQNTLNVEEFDLAFKYMNEKKTQMSLEKLGISPTLLALSLGTLIIILILLFVFIFLGIKAFTVGGTFGAIVNSIIPMAAASGAAGSQENKKDKIKEEALQNAIQEASSIIHSNRL